MSEVSRRRVTYGQLEQLWEFLNRNKSLALGFNKTAEAREFSQRMWKEVAESLNSHGDGAVKDWRGWSKYWSDYKSKLKKTVANASQHRTGGGPSNVTRLTDIEKKFVHFIGLPGIRVVPFEKEIPETTEGGSEIIKLESAEPVTLENLEESSESSLNIFASPLQEIAQSPQPGPSSHITPPLPAPLSPIRRSVTPNIETTSRRSPRRRRQMRREIPMTQEAARRTLIEISNRRADIEERRVNIEEHNSGLFESLINEIREIKEILRLRRSASPRDGE